MNTIHELTGKDLKHSYHNCIVNDWEVDFLINVRKLKKPSIKQLQLQEDILIKIFNYINNIHNTE